MPSEIDQANHTVGPFLDYAYILDENFERVMLIDGFREFVWTERYNESGDFEMVLPVTPEYSKEIRLNRYLTIKGSDVLMTIDNYIVSTDVEGGDFITVKGRSLEALLSRRIIWTKFTAKKTDKLQDSIKALLDQNVIKPTDDKRRIDGFEFQASDDKTITELAAAIEEEHTNLYDVVKGLCEGADLGFKVRRNEETGKMIFSLYMGVDRSWGQEDNPVVLFSSYYENLISSEYVQNEEKYISSVLVKDNDGKTAELYRKPERVGIKRREGAVTIEYQSDAEKTQDALVQKTIEALKENGVTIGFDGEVDPFGQFVLNKDYFIGDIVQFEDHYGHTGRARITEIVWSNDDRGLMMTPTFIILDGTTIAERT